MKEKRKKIYVEYNRVKFSSAKAKLRFKKIFEINKCFIVERGMDFELGQNFQFKGLIDGKMALG